MSETRRTILYDIEATGSDKLLDELGKIKKENEELSGANKELNKEIRAGGDGAQQAAKKFEQNRLAIQSNRDRTRELNKEIKANIQASKLSGDSIEDMRKRRAALTTQVGRLTKTEKENTAAGRAKVAELTKLNDEIREQTMLYGDTRENVGNYTDSIEAATGSVSALRTELAAKQKRLDLLDTKSDEYRDLGNEVNKLTNDIGVLTGEYDEFGNRAKRNPAAEEFSTMADSAKGAMSSLALLNMAMGDSQDAAQMQARAVQAMAISQNAHNIVVGASKIPQTALILRTKLIAGGAGAATIAQNLWTASVKLFSKSIYNIPVFGWLLAIIGAIIAGVKLLIKYWDRITAFFKSGTKDAEDQAEAMERLRDRSEAYRREREELNRVSKVTQENMSHEIALLKAQEASTEEIRQAERRLLEEKLHNAQQSLRLRELELGATYEQVKAYWEEHRVKAELAGITQERIDQYFQEIEAIKLLQRELELFGVREETEQRKRAEVRREEHEKKLLEEQQQREQEIEEQKKQYEEDLAEAERFNAEYKTLEDKAEEERRQRRVAEYQERKRLRKLERDEQVKQAEFEIQLMKEVQAATAKNVGLLANNLQQMADDSSAFAGFAKTLAIAETAFSITQGLAKTLKAGYPQNIPLAIGFAAQTTGLISQIRNIQVPQAPTFAKGGMIGGSPHSAGGTKFVGSDGSRFEAERDEYLAVVNKRDAPRAAMLDAVNRRHGKPFYRSSKNFFRDGGSFSPRQDFERFNIEEIVRETIDAVVSIPVTVSERDITSTQRNVEVLENQGNL